MKHFLIKNIHLILLVTITIFTTTFAAEGIELPDKDVSSGLPQFKEKVGEALGMDIYKSTPHGFISSGISEAIKYLGLIAVITLTIGGIMYIISFGSDDKTKRAKNVIIYSVVGVIVAMAAYLLVDIINNFTF